MGHFANRLRTVAGRVPCLVVAAFLAVSLFPAAASAASLPVGTTFTGAITVGGTSYDCTYEVTGANTVQIGNGTDVAIDMNAAGALSIPSSVSYGGDSYAVTSVGGYAFCHCTYLTSTGLGANSTVATVGHMAFADCISLASTGLGTNSTLTTLDEGVFYDCTSLASTGLGTNSTVTAIGPGAFEACTSLTSTGLGTNSTVTTIGLLAFGGCRSLTGDLVLGSAVSSVGPRAFVYTGLSATYLLAADPSSVSVGDAAFDFSSSGDYASILYVPSSWDGTTSFTAGSHTYQVSDGTLVIMDPAVLSDVAASRSSARDASVSFTSSASGTASIVDASGATVWTGPASAGVPVSASLPGVGPAAASLTVRMEPVVYPSSSTPAWYNTAAGCSARLDVPASAYTISFDGNGSGSGSMADEPMIYGEAASLTANAYARDGYAFAGWNDKADGTGTAYSDQRQVSDLAESGTVTLYAQWKANAVVPGSTTTIVTTTTTTTTTVPQTGDQSSLTALISAMLLVMGAVVAGVSLRAREGARG